MRAVKTEPKAPTSRHDNRAGNEPAAAINHNALRSASASMIVYVNHVNQEVVIHDGICQGSGGAPGGGTASKAQDEGQKVS